MIPLIIGVALIFLVWLFRPLAIAWIAGGLNLWTTEEDLLAAGRTIRKDHKAHISGWWTIGILVGILLLGTIMNLMTDWGSR